MTPFQLTQSGYSCSCDKIDVGSCRLPADGHGESYPSRCLANSESCDALDGSFGSVGYHRNNGGTCMCHAFTDHEFIDGDVVDEPTLYGACRNASGDVRCSFAPSDCADGEMFVDHLTAKCTCEEVKVGACYHFLGKMCAVTADACSAPSKYITPIEAWNKGMDCRLCSFEGTTLDTDFGKVDAEVPAMNVDVDQSGSVVTNEKEYSGAIDTTGNSMRTGTTGETGKDMQTESSSTNSEGSNTESSLSASAMSATSANSEDQSTIMILLYTVSSVAVVSTVTLLVVLVILFRRNKKKRAMEKSEKTEEDLTSIA